MDFGGGKINKKEIFIVLILFSLALPLGMSLTSAANPASAVSQNQSVITDHSSSQDSTVNTTTTNTGKSVQQQSENVQSTSKPMAAGENSSAVSTQAAVNITNSQLYAAAANVKKFVDTNHRLPNFVTISGQQITLPQFLQLLTDGFLNINNGQSNSLTIKNVSNPLNPSETVKSGNIQKTEYVQLAQNLKNFVDVNGRLPNYVTSSLGKIRYESMVYMYSKIIDFYSTSGRLPTYVSAVPWSSLSSEGTPITDPSLQKYLQPTANCQSNSATIISKANSITAGITSTYSKAQAIFNWVRDHTSYSFYENTKKGALGTLSSGSANCCDHSHLVIALARAAGIPGRYIHVYNHVYAQLYVNGVWYNADAINNSNYFGQSKSSTILGIYAALPF